TKSLRRVFLDEFFGEAGVCSGGEQPADAEALKKARAFYDRVLVGYGDDSVAQLGGAHLAVERVSNVAVQVLEDARLGIAFLEKSTRYVRFDQRDDAGDFLWYREPTLMASRHRDAYVALMDRLFATYAAQIDPMIAHIERVLPIESVPVRHPRTGEPLEFSDVKRDEALLRAARRAYTATVRAHACDVMRSYLPAATLTNLGIFATGQAFEHLLNRLHSHPAGECRILAAVMRHELDRLIPSFVKRSAPSAWLEGLRERAAAAAKSVLPAGELPTKEVTLVDFDRDGEEKVLAALLYPHAERPLADVRARVRAMSPSERATLLSTLAAGRRNRRDKPPRALEETAYTFDLIGNLGIYRDLHRHRVLSQERQLFTTAHGHDTPPEIVEAGHGAVFEECMARAHDLYQALRKEHPAEAPYVVPFAFRVRWYVTLNLREAVHLCELRSMPQGHPDYRLIVQEIWRRIEEVHPGLAPWGGFVNRDTYRLGRLQSEMRTEWKRAQPIERNS
ncbi:MAG TPA: FAD-dependent thymidylate synthase, partial [Thermoanaerobaculia bacterium]|nr:FAD-dependent thymidylate synthase [Thermoanaerobaculia bacterium]